MSSIKEPLCRFFSQHDNSPFLFVGSGFSKRYLGLETWEELLRRFSSPIRDFGYYKSLSDGDLSLCAEFMAKDYFVFWWESLEKASIREEYKNYEKLKSVTPLKIDISHYLLSKSTPHNLREDFICILDQVQSIL